MIGRNVAWYIKLSLSFILLLVVLWGFAVKALHEALGTFGIVIFLVLAGLLLGGLYQIGWIDINNVDTMGWYMDVIMTLMLFFGLMFPVWWRQLTGKVAVEDDFN